MTSTNGDSRARLFSEIASGQPVYRSRHLDTDLDNLPKRRKTIGTNSKFDRMVETMSIVSSHFGQGPTRGKKGRRADNANRSTDAYSPPQASHLARGLSFIKMDKPIPLARNDDRSSSDTNEPKISDKISPSSFKRYNPLPGWLANTFMSLSRKHPLRLLLPSTSTPTLADEPAYPEVAESASSDTVFADAPSPAENLYDALAENIPECVDFQRSSTAHNVTGYPDALFDSATTFSPQPLPFSTPGPRPLLGSSTATGTAISVRSHICSSPTLYHPESYVASGLPDTPYFHTKSFEFKDNADESGSDSIQLDNTYFSEVYATPGPTHYAPRPVHFDSPTEDPLGSDFIPAGLEIHYKDIDFEWKAFDRTHLVAPSLPKDTAFTCGTFVGPLDHGGHKVPLTPVEHPANISVQNVLVSEPLVSPCPFRFLLPPPTDGSATSSTAPPHQQAKIFTTPPPFAPVPGIYISPLGRPELEPRTPSSPSARLTGNRITANAARIPIRTPTHIGPDSPGLDGSPNGFQHEGRSQCSSDSIESWSE